MSVSTEEGAQRWLDLPHRRLIYRRLGVPVVELPNGRFAVRVEDVDAALREQAAASPTPAELPRRPKGRDEEVLEAALRRTGGLRVVGGRR